MDGAQTYSSNNRSEVSGSVPDVRSAWHSKQDGSEHTCMCSVSVSVHDVFVPILVQSMITFKQDAVRHDFM